jgi:hypothetical protein
MIKAVTGRPDDIILAGGPLAVKIERVFAFPPLAF